MASWKVPAWDDDGDGWEDVAAAPGAVAGAQTSKTHHQASPALAKRNNDSSKQITTNASSERQDASADAHRSANSVVNEHESKSSSDQTEQDEKESQVQAKDNNVSSIQAALAASERRVVALTRERDNLRRARDARVSAVENAKEKDKQIAALLEEGNQLSVKIAEKENALRTAKASLKENEAKLATLNNSLSAAEAKVEALAAKNRTLETSEKAATEGKNAAEKRLRQLESDLRTKSSSSAALDAARSQLESLRKSNTAALETQAMRLRAEADVALEKVKDTAKQESDELQKVIAELRLRLKQISENAGWKEDQLRREITELRARAEVLEARNEELAEAVPNATRPLLRQVEALQAAANERMRVVSAVERSQLSRLQAAEAAVAAGKERERAADSRVGTLLAKVASLEEQVKIGTSENARLLGELRKARGTAAETELAHQRALDEVQANTMKLVRERESLLDELSKARSAHLDESEAAEERERSLRQKIGLLESKLRNSLTRSNSAVDAADVRNFAACASPTAYVASSVTSPQPHRTASENMAESKSKTGNSVTAVSNDVGSPANAVAVSSLAAFAEISSLPGGLYDTERLQAVLRQRTEEVQSLQGKIAGKEAATQALADEIITLTSRVENLTTDLENAPQLRKDFDDLKHRHSTLLVLLGEREERIQELEADLSDVNQMYKEQITELLLKLES